MQTFHRQRRIKCDEKRPSCSNCIRSKKICTGYPPPSRAARPYEVLRIAPKPIADGDHGDLSIQHEYAPIIVPVQAHLSTAAPVSSRGPAAAAKRLQKYQKRAAAAQNQAYGASTALAPVIQRYMEPTVLYMPSMGLPFTETEGLYFQLFRENTASELSGFFDNIFWSRGVLQECHNEAAIRHAVVALGALYKTLEKTCESPPGSPNSSRDSPDSNDSLYRHWEMAVKKYSHAIHELFVISIDDTRTHRTRLMASVLLACFDSFIGDHRQAIKQIQNGLSLLEQLRAERRRAFLPHPEEPVEEELIQMFTRLAIQAKSYDMAFHFPHPYVIQLTGPAKNSDPNSPEAEPQTSRVSLYRTPMPERFTSSRQARLAWDALVERIFRFTETMFHYVSNGPMGLLPPELIDYGKGFKDEIQAWSDAYEHILASRMAPGISSQEKAAIAVLKMAQMMSQILFLMTFSHSEMQFDAFNPMFRGIVALALEVVGDEERRAMAKRCPDPRFCNHPYDQWTEMYGYKEYAARHIKPSFSADLGIVPSLFVVATKCRDPVIRRQAIQLLKSSSRREGMWDSELAARIGIWIAEVEEREDPPEQQQAWLPSSRPSTSSTSSGRQPSTDFGDDVQLGPGGNARYDPRRVSQVPTPRLFQKTVPAEKRVMIKAIEFDLRDRRATIQLGTRGLPNGAPDLKTQSTQILW